MHYRHNNVRNDEITGGEQVIKDKKSFFVGLFQDDFKTLKKADEPIYKTPKSVQQTLDILRVSPNGIFEIPGNKYTKTYRFRDVNYTTNTQDEQYGTFENYCKLLNALDIPYKITINNKNKNMAAFKQVVLFPFTDDSYNVYREALNENIKEKISQGRQGIEQEKLITIITERKNYEDAKVYFNTFENSINIQFMELGSEIVALNCNERLKILHDFYRIGNEDQEIDIHDYINNYEDWKNDVCCTKIRFKEFDFETDHRVCRTMYIRKFPSSLSDKFLCELANLPINTMISIDVIPIPKDLANKILNKKYMGIENDIRKQQKTRNRNNDFSSDISYIKRTEKKEIEGIMDDFRENDQMLFFTAVSILIIADNLKHLDEHCSSINTVVKKYSCETDTYYLQQREALNTVLPIGNRQIENMRVLLTQSLAALMPFYVQELKEIDKDSVFYGINQVSKEEIIGNRKKLQNGNGFIFGIPGSGKSFDGKTEMSSIFLNTKDDIIIIDPTLEYMDVVERYDGTTIELSNNTETFINPLDVDLENLTVKTINSVIRNKAEMMLGICEQFMDGEVINVREKSIVDRCIRFLYTSILDIPIELRKQPLMGEFYDILQTQEEPEAKKLALSLELFIEGSLNIFNNYTNINVDNRVIAYGINDLGEGLYPVAMLIMLENIKTRIRKNAAIGRATWLYIDEFHNIVNRPFTSKYIVKLWKEIRKLGGLCTGITQNVIDVLRSPESQTLISNSEFIMLMKQSALDMNDIENVFEGFSRAMLKYVSNAPCGTGLIKHGSVIIPFDNVYNKDNLIYSMFNTNLHERARKSKSKDLIDKEQMIEQVCIEDSVMNSSIEL